MSCRDENRRRSRPGVAFALTLACFLSLPASIRAQSRLELLGARGTSVEWALTEAAQRADGKLADLSCRLLFSDFRDVRGRLLQDTLDALGQSAQSYFGGLDFYDGYGRFLCESREIIAFTSPGSRAVFVCAPQFVERVHQDPGLAAALLIHEELHALGLGENPPSSKAITARVISRCGK